MLKGAMLRHAAVCLLLTTVVTGCLGYRDSYVVWTASLHTLPASDCVRESLASIPNVSLADFKHEEPSFRNGRHDAFHYYIQTGDVPGYRLGMGLHLIRSYKGATQFHLGYADFGKYDALQRATAQDLVSNIADRCAVPELLAQAHEEHLGDWHPYGP